MAEYIEREAALKELNRNSITKKLTLANGVSIFDTIKNIPAADVVEVVRCKDCMWWYPREYGSVIGRCENPYNGLATEYIEEDDFCSFGERKEGAENG